MKAFAGWLAAVLFIVALQGSVMHFITINGVRPDLVLIFVLLSGVLYGRTQGLVVGFFCGLCVDLMNSGMFGFYTFAFMLVGILTGMAQKNVFEENFFLPFTMVAAASLTIKALWLLGIWTGGHRITAWGGLMADVFSSTVYNMVVTLPILFLFIKVKKLVNQ